MIRLIGNQKVYLFLLVACLLYLGLGGVPVTSAQGRGTGVQWDAPMHIPSPEETWSWFPDLTVDSQGRVHVIWSETNPEVMGTKDSYLAERVFYSMWDGNQWSAYNDIVPPQADIIRNAIAIDNSDTLHMLFDYRSRSGGFGLFYQKAPVDDAWSAASWSSPWLVNSRGFTYMSDIAVFEDEIHIVYDDAHVASGDTPETVQDECPVCADVFYRYSADQGQTWSTPIDLFPTTTGSSRAQMEVDSRGTIHIAWDEGWDRLTGQGEPLYGVYVHSADGGITWSPPFTVTYPVTTNAQMTVGSDGQGGVMLMWRTTSQEYPGIYYLWSADQGQTWSAPQTLPRITAQSWTNQFDVYDMATDSAGHIHALVTGFVAGRERAVPGLYHYEWDGERWSSPTPVYEDGAGVWYPHYPHLVIAQGNQLHATWFTRKGIWKAEVEAPHRIWYAHGQSQAPTIITTPRPKPTIPAPTPTPVTAIQATLAPTLSPEQVAAAPMSQPNLDEDMLLLLLLSSGPVLAVLLIILITRRIRT
ncbi:MAG TPA: sialidase family protein [Anaerolineae bacterium]